MFVYAEVIRRRAVHVEYNFFFAEAKKKQAVGVCHGVEWFMKGEGAGLWCVCRGMV